MEYQDILLKNYHARSNLLDFEDTAKLEWFIAYIEKMYQKYLAPISRTGTILELGCNKGFLLKGLENLGFKNLYGVDLSEGDLAVAQHMVPCAQLFFQDAFDYLDQNHNKFDVIILKALIEHIKKDKVLLLLDKINKSLKTNGMVLIDVYNADWIFALHDRYMDFTHELGFTKESLLQIMQLYFPEVTVTPTPSFLWKMGTKAKLRHYLAKKIFFSLVKWAEPETPAITERILIGVGRKKELENVESY